MTDQEIRTAQEGIVSAFRSDPNSAYSTAGVEAPINHGIACHVTDGTNVAQVDMPIG